MPILTLFRPVRRRVRRFFRQRMMPITVDEAMAKREFYAKIYCLSSFTLLTVLIYQLYKQKMDMNADKIGEATIEKLKLTGKVRVMRFEGFKKVQDYFYERKKDENQNTDLVIGATPEHEI